MSEVFCIATDVAFQIVTPLSLSYNRLQFVYEITVYPKLLATVVMVLFSFCFPHHLAAAC
jgi:hypothetical protein